LDPSKFARLATTVQRAHAGGVALVVALRLEEAHVIVHIETASEALDIRMLLVPVNAFSGAHGKPVSP